MGASIPQNAAKARAAGSFFAMYMRDSELKGHVHPKTDCLGLYYCVLPDIVVRIQLVHQQVQLPLHAAKHRRNSSCVRLLVEL